MSQPLNPKSNWWMGVITICLILLFTYGCSGQPPSAEQETLTSAANSSSDEGASQDPADTDPNADSNLPDISAESSPAPPETPSLGPHDGTMTSCKPLNLEFEVVIDRKDQMISVYVWHAVKKVLTPIAAKKLSIDIKVPEMQIELTPVKNIGEPTDMSSLFKGSNSKLATDQKLAGTITVTIERVEHELKFYELPSASIDF